MDDRHSAMLWQLMQGLSAQPGGANNAPPPTFEHTLASLRPLLSPKQQKIIDLMTKMNEVKVLLQEIQES